MIAAGKIIFFRFPLFFSPDSPNFGLMRQLPAWLLLFFLADYSSYGQESKPIKALWVVRDALKTRASVEQMVSEVTATGITDVFLQVRGRGDAYYQSDFVPKAVGIESGFDPLDCALRLLRPHPVRVHLWLNVFLIWSADEMPSSPNHIYRVFPEWSVVDRNNRSMAELGARKVKSMQSEGIFFSPSAEAYREHFLRVVRELVTRYSADGIHLDYIRFPGEQYDYSVSARSQFMLKYHIDPLLAEQNRLSGLTKEQQRWVVEKWNEFRKGLITEFVGGIRDSLRQWKESMLLTAAVFADLQTAKNRIFQNWPEWIRRGFVDYAVTMNYAADDQTFRQRVRILQDELGEVLCREKVIQGIALYNQSPSSVLNKIRICNELRLLHLSFFSYQAMVGKKGYREIVIHAVR